MGKLAPKRANIRSRRRKHGGLPFSVPATAALWLRHRERVRTANLNYIRHSGITSVEANVVYATARKT